MPGADLLFLPLPFAHAARGSGAGPATNGLSTGDIAAEVLDTSAIDPVVGAWSDAANVVEAWRGIAERWQRIAGERGRALRRIAELGDIAAGGLTPGDGLNARLIPGTDPARVSVVADAWNAMRMAMVDAGLQVQLDDKL